MIRTKNTICFVLLMTAAAFVVGCSEANRGKQLVRARWLENSAAIKLSLAHQQYQQGLYEKAISNLRQAAEVFDDDLQINLLMGKCLLEIGHIENAQKEFEVVVRTNENLPQGWFWMGVAAQAKNDYQSALVFYRRAMDISPLNSDYILKTGEVYMLLGLYDQAESVLLEALRKTDDVQILAAAGRFYFDTADYEKATILFDRAHSKEPDNIKIAEGLAHCHLMNENWEQAAGLFDSCARAAVAGEANEFFKLAAVCYLNNKDYSKAYLCFSRAGSVEDGSTDFWIKAGQAALGAGSGKRAFVCAKKALKMNPANTDAISVAGSGCYLAGDYREAVKYFQILTDKSPNSGFGWLMRAKCYEKMGKADAAQKAYRVARRLDINDEFEDLLVKAAR